MIKAVLLDLDDTLLGNPTGPFVRNYLGLLKGYLEERLALNGVTELLLAGTEAVVRSDDPLHSNRETFYAVVDSRLTVERAQFDAAVDEFYRAVYPQLRATVTFRPGARALVDGLIAQGYAVAVATNPFFPRVAIAQRLAWAGVPADEVPFALVTSLENMHYAKPHSAYYEEILARIGVQADEAIMIGDDWRNDIVPAAAAGLNTFWVTDGSALPEDAGDVAPDGLGTLDDFARCVQAEDWLTRLTPRSLRPDQIVPRLKGNLAALLGMTREAPSHVWEMHPDRAEWSPLEVLCHLVESERDVQRPRLITILEQDNPFLSQPKAPPGPSMRACAQSAGQEALAFAAERQHTLDLLTGLDAAAWDRPARHSIFGPTTLLEMANFTAQHDRLHLTQLCQTVGKCL